MALDPRQLKNVKLTGQPGEAYMLGVGRSASKQSGGLPTLDSKRPRHGVYNHMFPAVWHDSEAWVFVNGAWREHEPFAMWVDAGLMSEGEFRTRFPDLPPLPRFTAD